MRRARPGYGRRRPTRPPGESTTSAEMAELMARRREREPGGRWGQAPYDVVLTPPGLGADKVRGLPHQPQALPGHPTALHQGWPIATGIIEGACRHLVKDRMDITGARWGLPGAEAVHKLRARTATTTSTRRTGATTSTRKDAASTPVAMPTTPNPAPHELTPRRAAPE